MPATRVFPARADRLAVVPISNSASWLLRRDFVELLMLELWHVAHVDTRVELSAKVASPAFS